jgi:hypothetical protein
MVKTTYALTLFAAVSLAAPVSQLTGRAEKQGSVENKNILQGLPNLVCVYWFFNELDYKKGKLTPTDKQNQVVKRDESHPEHKNIIDELPIIGKLLGNVRCPLGANISNTNIAVLIGAPK